MQCCTLGQPQPVRMFQILHKPHRIGTLLPLLLLHVLASDACWRTCTPSGGYAPASCSSLRMNSSALPLPAVKHDSQTRQSKHTLGWCAPTSGSELQRLALACGQTRHFNTGEAARMGENNMLWIDPPASEQVGVHLSLHEHVHIHAAAVDYPGLMNSR